MLTAVIPLTLGVAACGSSKNSTSTTTPSSTAAVTRTGSSTAATSAAKSKPPAAPLPAPAVSGSSGGMRAWLHATGHSPKAGKPWHYSVLAAGSANRPLTGTVDTEFVFGGAVVGRESPPTHALKNGRLNDHVTFPARSVGVPLTFQIVVHTHLGTVTLDWPVKTQR